jgi:signal transduction histidine kinase
MRDRTTFENYLVNNLVRINPQTFYVGFVLVTAIYLASIYAESQDGYLPVLIKDSLSVLGFILTYILRRKKIISVRIASAALVYIVMIGQNATLIHALITNSPGYQSLLMFAVITDFFVIFIAGFILPITNTLIVAAVLMIIAGVAGFLAPDPSLRYLGYVLPAVLSPFVVFFFFYRRTIESLIEKILQARRRLTEKNRILKETQAYLVTQEKLSALGSLTTGIAHEINNPMRFVKNYSEINGDLLNELFSHIESPDSHMNFKRDETYLQLKKTLLANTDRIAGEGTRVSQIVSSLLTHARERDVRMVESNLETVIRQSIPISDQLEAISVSINLPDHRVLASIVPGDFSRVITNLIDNACYSVKKKSLSSGDEYQPQIVISLKESDDKVIIRVWDNGLGINSDLIPKIGQPFFTTKEPGEGTGLGMSICRDIIHTIHKGRIDIHSREGEFALFTITVPRTQDAIIG